MLRQYESVFISTPLLTEEQTKEVVGKFKNFLEQNGSEVVHEEYWGLKKLAYPIRKKSTGFYHLLEFKAPPDLIQRFEVEYKRDERIMRFLTIELDKFAVEYNERRRRGEVGKATPGPIGDRPKEKEDTELTEEEDK